MAANKEFVGTPLNGLFGTKTEGHGHGFGCCGSFIEQRGIGQFHTGEFHHHGLEIQNGFHTALGNFCLIRRIGRVPPRIFEDISQNRRRRMGSIITLSYEIMGNHIFLCQLPDMRKIFGFRHGRKYSVPFPTDALRYHFCNKLVEGPDI